MQEQSEAAMRAHEAVEATRAWVLAAEDLQQHQAKEHAAAMSAAVAKITHMERVAAEHRARIRELEQQLQERRVQTETDAVALADARAGHARACEELQRREKAHELALEAHQVRGAKVWKHIDSYSKKCDQLKEAMKEQQDAAVAARDEAATLRTTFARSEAESSKSCNSAKQITLLQWLGLLQS